tara:strand:- start:2995 stop:3822 length:828 start_codon:yes stop_codon:yes gene_type:complete
MMADSNVDSLFDQSGRRIPFEGMRVFNLISLKFYKIKQPQLSFKSILNRSKKYLGVSENISENSLKIACDKIKREVSADSALGGLFNGVHVPFICPKDSQEKDLGFELETKNLPSVESSFKSEYPNLHFKKNFNGDFGMRGNLSLAEGSRYENLIQSRKKSSLAGWYFPQALQEYDIPSQRKQMDTLPFFDNLILSGIVDVSAALVGSPGLLINKDSYPPVLCLPAIEHKDRGITLCYKAYGLHLEFWCMSMMLTPSITQVSEQWTGGLSIFTSL